MAAALVQAEILRTMGETGTLGASYSGPPARISSFRFADSTTCNDISGLTDLSCDVPQAQEPLVQIANMPESPFFNIAQPLGAFRCRYVDPATPCSTATINCGSTPNHEICDFIRFVRSSICSLGVGTVTITQQTQQSPSPAVDGEDVTLSVAATAAPDANQIHYQWRRNGTNITGATSPTLTLHGPDACGAAGSYTCQILSPCETETSNSLALSVSYNDGDCDGSSTLDVCDQSPTFAWAGSVGGTEPEEVSGLGADTTWSLATRFKYGDGIALDSTGATVVYTGSFIDTADLDPTGGTDNKTSLSTNFDAFVTKLTASGPTYGFSSVFGTTDSNDDGFCVAVSAHGGQTYVYVAGGFGDGAIDFNGAPSGGEHTAATNDHDAFIVKLNLSSGAFVWSRVLGGSELTAIQGIAVDSNGAVIVSGGYIGTIDFDPTGGTDSRSATGDLDPFVTKLNSDGTYAWTRVVKGAATGSVNTATDVAVDSSNNVYCVGYYSGASVASPAYFNPPSSAPHASIDATTDIFVTKFASNGTYDWTKVMGGTWEDYGLGIEVDHQCGVVIVGAFETLDPEDPISFDLDCQLNTGVMACAIDCEGCTDCCHLSEGGLDAFVAKIDNAGQAVWSRTFGGESNDVAIKVAVDSMNNALIAGYFADAEIDESGCYCRDANLGLSADFDPSPGSADVRFNAGRRDGFITQIHADGGYGWTETLGGLGNDEVRAVKIAAGGDIWLTGTFQGSLDFDPGLFSQSVLTAAGDPDVNDVFVLRLSAPGIPFLDCDGNGISDECDCVHGDVNDDGEFDGLDIQPFVDCLLASPLACPCADLDWNGEVEMCDIPCFVDALLSKGQSRCSTMQCPAVQCEADIFSCDDGMPHGHPADCNENYRLDSLDIHFGTSLDCNGNAIPDECEIAECESDWTCADVNSNSILDGCEPDCNENEVPDDVDISSETSVDCNSNDVPDECEADCNENGVPDDCDVDPLDPDGNTEVSADCNGDGWPDECDADCDENGVPDDCDVDPLDPDGDSWVDPDCNANGWPDACDIDAGPPFGSLDVDEDGVPDECEEESLMGGGGESMMSGGSSCDASYWPEDYSVLSNEMYAAWEAFTLWCMQEEWGPDSAYSGAEQLERLIEKKHEVGICEDGLSEE